MGKRNGSMPVRAGESKKNKISEWSGKKKLAAGIIGVSAIGAIIFAIVLVVVQLSSVHPIKSTKEEAKVVGTCDGYEVKYEELRYVASINRAELERKYGEYDGLDADMKVKFDSELTDMVEHDIKSNYVVLSLCKKYGIKTESFGINRYVNNCIQRLVDEEMGGDVEKYKKWLADNELTDSFVRLTYKVDYLEGLLLEKFVKEKIGVKYDETSGAEFVDYVVNGGDYVKTIHVFYPHTHPVPDKTDYDARKLADAAIAKLSEAKDDEDRLAIISSLIGTAPFVPGYSVQGKTDFYFTYGQMNEKYEEVAFSLDEYEVGELLETTEGYYIIMRVPMDGDEIKNSSMTNTLLVQYQYAVLKAAEDKRRDEIKFVGNAYFDSLDLAEID